MSAYLPLPYWSSGEREGYYNLPGTSPYELNMFVSTPQGPAYGPKGSIYKHKLSNGAKTGIGISVAVIIAVLLWYFLIHKQGTAYYF